MDGNASDPLVVSVFRSVVAGGSGATAAVCEVVPSGKHVREAFQIQVSADAVFADERLPTTTGTGGTETLAVNGTGQYVRVYGTARGTPYGYSLWSSACTPARAGAATRRMRQPTGRRRRHRRNTPACRHLPPTATPRPGQSAFSDPQWLVDLGSTAVCEVVLQWESAYAKAFRSRCPPTLRPDERLPTTTGKGGTETLAVNGAAGRPGYGTARDPYGYSLWGRRAHRHGWRCGTAEPPEHPTLLSDTFSSATIEWSASAERRRYRL